MNPFLLTALKKRLQDDLADLMLETRDGKDEDKRRPVQVFIGDLPPKKRAPGQTDPLGEYFPCIILVPTSGSLEDGEDATVVAVIFAVFCPEDGDAEGAEMDFALLLSRIKQSLRPCVTKPLEKRFRLIEDAKGYFPWEKSDMQPRPYIQATMMTHWRMKGLEGEGVAHV